MQKSKIALMTLTLVLGILLTAGLAQAAVELSRFEGRWETSPQNKIFLLFETGSETQHAYFDVWRSTENLPITANQIDTSRATRIIPTSENDDTEIVNGSVRNGDGPCSAAGQIYEVSDLPASGDTVYYYYLESYSCSGGDTEFHGNEGDTAGLEVRRPGSEAPTNTPTATQSGGTNPTSTATTQAQVTRTNTPQATAEGGGETQPTAGPTGTLIPSATTGTGTVATPTTRPNVTATTGSGTGVTATATTRPAPTNPPQPTVAGNTNPNPPTTAPQPTIAGNTNPPTTAAQPTIATQPTDGAPTVAPVISDSTVPTETPPPDIAAAFTPVSTAAPVGGDMSQGGTAPTPTLSAAFASNGGTDETTEVEGQEGPIVAGDTGTAGIDRLIQGLVAVIIIGVIGLGGFLGWSYYRSRA